MGRRGPVLVGAGVGAAALLVAGLVLVGGGSGRDAGVFLVGIAYLVAVAGLIGADSRARGRSGGRWLLACVLLGPFGLAAFAVVAVGDRLRGRPGLEARWGRRQGLALFGALALSLAAGALLLTSPQVPDRSVTVAGGSATYGGACSSVLSTAFGQPAWLGGPTDPQEPAAFRAAEDRVTADCATVTAHRLGQSEGLLAAALVLAVLGAASTELAAA